MKRGDLTQVNNKKTSSHRNRRNTKVLDIIRPPTNTVETPRSTHVITHSPSPIFLLTGMSSGAGVGGSWMFSAMVNELKRLCHLFLAKTEHNSEKQKPQLA